MDQDTVKEFARELLHNDYILSLAGFENIDDISDEEMDTFVEDFVVYFDSLDISFDLDGDIVVLHAVSAEGTPAFTNFALSSETSSLDMKLDEVADVSIVVENTVSSSPDYTLTLVESGDMLIEIVGSMTKNADELLIDGTIEVVSAVFAPLVGGDLTPDENMIITYSIVETSADASLDVLVIPTSDEYVLAEDIESGLGSIVSFE